MDDYYEMDFPHIVRLIPGQPLPPTWKEDLTRPNTLIFFTDVSDAEAKVIWDTRPGARGPQLEEQKLGIFNLWGKAKADYFDVVDNPKRLPFFLHPLIGQEDVVPFSRDLLTPSLTLRNAKGVPRTLYARIDMQNAKLGALGGLLVGSATPDVYCKGHGPLGMTWLKSVEAGVASPLQKLGYGSLVASRMVKRALIAGMAYDMIKRNLEMGSKGRHWMNSTLPGVFLGGVFGASGGFRTSALGAVGFGLGAMVHHIFLISTDKDDQDY